MFGCGYLSIESTYVLLGSFAAIWLRKCDGFGYYIKDDNPSKASYITSRKMKHKKTRVSWYTPHAAEYNDLPGTGLLLGTLSMAPSIDAPSSVVHVASAFLAQTGSNSLNVQYMITWWYGDVVLITEPLCISQRVSHTEIGSLLLSN